MADELKIPSFSKQKKLKAPKEVKQDVVVQAPLPKFDLEIKDTFVALTDDQIESCRKGQDIFDFARDIEELVRVNNKI